MLRSLLLTLPLLGSAFIVPSSVGPAASSSSSAALVRSSPAAAFARVPLKWELASTAEGQQPEGAVAAEGEAAGEAEDSLQGWQLCWEDIKTLPPEENSQTPLILRSTTDTSYLKDRFFVLLRHKGGVQLIDSSCGRCSFPLINSPIIDEPRLAQEDNTAIACKVCGMRHSIVTGRAVKPKSAGLGMGQSVGNFFFKRGEAKDIESVPTKIMPDGKIYAKIPPLKVKRPTTDMIVL